MNLKKLETNLKRQPVFTTHQLAVYFPEQKRNTLRQNLYNWQKAGYVYQLKKGLYALAQEQPDQAKIANLLYEPSYLSLQYALSYYQLMPDVTYQMTSVTTRKTKTFSNSLGTFWYRHVKPNLYFGFQSTQGYLLADPEKALLDHLYLNKNSLHFDDKYVDELRLQNLETIDPTKMQNYLERFDVPKLTRFWQFCQTFHGL